MSLKIRLSNNKKSRQNRRTWLLMVPVSGPSLQPTFYSEALSNFPRTTSPELKEGLNEQRPHWVPPSPTAAFSSSSSQLSSTVARTRRTYSFIFSR